MIHSSLKSLGNGRGSVVPPVSVAETPRRFDSRSSFITRFVTGTHERNRLLRTKWFSMQQLVIEKESLSYEISLLQSYGSEFLTFHHKLKKKRNRCGHPESLLFYFHVELNVSNRFRHELGHFLNQAGSFQVKLDTFHTKLNTLLSKLDAFEIKLNVFQSETSVF